MKKELLLHLVAAILIIAGTSCLGSDKFIYGFKGGINYSRIDYQEGYVLFVDNHSYPPGYLMGISLGINLWNDFAVISEVNFQASNVKMHILDGTDIIDQEFKLTFLKFPILLRYCPDLHFIPYLIIGPSFNYLIKARYSASAVFSDLNTKNDISIKNKLPSISTSMEFGIGKKINLANTVFLLFEIRGQLGILVKDNSFFTPKWYTKGLQFVCGLNLN